MLDVHLFEDGGSIFYSILLGDEPAGAEVYEPVSIFVSCRCGTKTASVVEQ
jgi:hypothetical protein